MLTLRLSASCLYLATTTGCTPKASTNALFFFFFFFFFLSFLFYEILAYCNGHTFSRSSDCIFERFFSPW